MGGDKGGQILQAGLCFWFWPVLSMDAIPFLHPSFQSRLSPPFSGFHTPLVPSSLWVRKLRTTSWSSISKQEQWRYLNETRRTKLLKIEGTVKRSPKRLKYTSFQTRKVSELLYLPVDPFGADAWRLEPAIKLLKDGAVGVIPTDTIYSIVCDVKNQAAVERIYRIKNMDAKKPLSILCQSFQDIDKYTTGFPCGNSQGQTSVFRAARHCLPGPYTFILPASKEMPKKCTDFGGTTARCVSRKSVGIRMPADIVCQAILEQLDGPLVCTSVRRRVDDEWMLDPAIIADMYGSSERKEGVDFIVDGGVRLADPSTVVDMTGVKPVLLRQGKGIVEDWMLMEGHDSVDAFIGSGLKPYA